MICYYVLLWKSVQTSAYLFLELGPYDSGFHNVRFRRIKYNRVQDEEIHIHDDEVFVDARVRVLLDNRETSESRRR